MLAEQAWSAVDHLHEHFCSRIRTALKPFKTCQAQIPSLHEQANIALRHHCKEGNLKWVSLMLWIGADPYARGPVGPDEELDGEYEGMSAIAYAALYRKYEVFDLKKLKLDPTHRETVRMVSSSVTTAAWTSFDRCSKRN